jgi:hypothetical protein
MIRYLSPLFARCVHCYGEAGLGWVERSEPRARELASALPAKSMMKLFSGNGAAYKYRVNMQV